MEEQMRHVFTKEDVEKLLDECVAASTDLVLTNIICHVDATIMMYNGLFPFDEPTQVDVDMLRMDKESFEFWHPLDAYHRYKDTTTWYYKTIESHRKNGIQKCISLPLMYVAPDLVYKQSKRPKTSMNIFRSPSSVVVDKATIVKIPSESLLSRVTIEGETFNIIPVSRYGAGMSKGLYHDLYENDPQLTSTLKGTFYYYEPESSTFLTFNTYRIYFNKTDAAIKLDQEIGGYYTKDYRKIENKSLAMHMSGELPEDLKLTPRQLVNIYGKTPKQYIPSYWRSTDEIVAPEIPHYIGLNPLSKIYGYEDELDNDIYDMGEELGIDILILTHMTGAYQVVTEIYDIREREVSFRNLVYTSTIE